MKQTIKIYRSERAVSKNGRAYQRLETSAGKLVYFSDKQLSSEVEAEIDGSVLRHADGVQAVAEQAPEQTSEPVLSTIAQTSMHFKFLREQCPEVSAEAALDVAARIAISESINNSQKRKWSK